MESKNESQKDYDSYAELYGDPGIASKNARIPRWLVFVNWFCVFIGLCVLYLYWNGSHGWLDRGYWGELQKAANTQYPYTTIEIIDKETSEKNI